MIAVAKIGGHQALVQVGDKLQVDKLNVEAGKNASFDVLLVSEPDGAGFQVGTPLLDGVKVEAKVLEHGRRDKIRVFKMKPRKRYRRTLGHRQDYTLIEITKIGGGKPQKTAPKAKAAAKPKAEKKAPAKKAAPKKTAAKKPAAKKVEKKTEKK